MHSFLRIITSFNVRIVRKRVAITGFNCTWGREGEGQQRRPAEEVAQDGGPLAAPPADDGRRQGVAGNLGGEGVVGLRV